jgi:predicted dehydrogenase
MEKKCWVLGAGYMAKEYIKILKTLPVNLTVIGRGDEKINSLKAEFNVNAISGGITTYIDSKPELPEFAIVAVSCEELYKSTKQLIKLGIKNILVEKPAGLLLEEIRDLSKSTEENNINLFVGYNRRFYHSVDLLRTKIREDGGIQSIHFEFSEWVQTIDTKKFPNEVLSKFLIANSTHVIDTVFFIAGKPKEFKFFSGGNFVEWHPSGSIFVGTGITENGVYFSYSSNWGAPGRWAIEVLTANSRYYLKPMEELAIQKKGSVDVNKVVSDYQIDINYKPGLYNLLLAFFDKKNDSRLCHIREHETNYCFYNLIGNYQ